MGMACLQKPDIITSVIRNQYINISIASASAEKPQMTKTSLQPVTFTDTPFPQSIGCQVKLLDGRDPACRNKWWFLAVGDW